jgi:hypothetical protein
MLPEFLQGVPSKPLCVVQTPASESRKTSVRRKLIQANQIAALSRPLKREASAGIK